SVNFPLIPSWPGDRRKRAIPIKTSIRNEIKFHSSRCWAIAVHHRPSEWRRGICTGTSHLCGDICVATRCLFSAYRVFSSFMAGETTLQVGDAGGGLEVCPGPLGRGG